MSVDSYGLTFGVDKFLEVDGVYISNSRKQQHLHVEGKFLLIGRIIELITEGYKLSTRDHISVELFWDETSLEQRLKELFSHQLVDWVTNWRS